MMTQLPEAETATRRLTYARIARRIRVPLGFVLAVVYLGLARATWMSIVLGSLIVLPGLWLRAVASGHVRKNAELTTSGPYRYSRNPLYLGSIIIAVGFGAASLNLWIAAVTSAMFLAIYLPVIKSEEEYLRSAFPGFDDYAHRVPRLFPRFFIEPGTTKPSFSRELYFKHREYNALLGSILMMLALAFKLVWFSRYTLDR